MRVVVTDFIEADLNWEAEEFAKRGVDFVPLQLKGAPVAEVIAATRDADVVIVNMVKITPDVMDGWTRCKLVVRHGAGYDNVDIAAATARGILVEYVPDYCTHEVAEQALALMLACARKVVSSRRVLDDSVARGAWDFTPVIPMHRFAGSTVGIVGCGRIGSQVLRKLGGFDVKVLVNDPYLSAKRRAALSVPLVDLETLCRESDYITLHTPLNAETRHLMNARSIGWMKPGAYLINTSRGGMVDAEALAEALREGRIAGAAIDVFEHEPPRLEYPLLGLEHAVLTPHLSWYSVEAEWTIREKILQAVDMHREGTGPRIAVNPEVLQGKKEV